MRTHEVIDENRRACSTERLVETGEKRKEKSEKKSLDGLHHRQPADQLLIAFRKPCQTLPRDAIAGQIYHHNGHRHHHPDPAKRNRIKTKYRFGGPRNNEAPLEVPLRSGLPSRSCGTKRLACNIIYQLFLDGAYLVAHMSVPPFCGVARSA